MKQSEKCSNKEDKVTFLFMMKQRNEIIITTSISKKINNKLQINMTPYKSI